MGGRATLIVPGLNGSGEGHWQHFWLRDHADTELVQQADWSDPQQGPWLATLEQAVRRHPGCLLVAHSLGTILTARLATSPVARLVGGALLVAPADITRTGDLHRRTYEFGEMPRRPLPFPALVVASRNDPYMAFADAGRLARDWQVPVHDLGAAGHVNIPAGFGRWTQGYGLAAALGAARQAG